jgi:hypothetical protein
MKSISLMIPVYKGGNYWKECWQSVLQNIDFFEHIVISFNKSELQDEDVGLVKNYNNPKVIYKAQTEFYSARDHFAKISELVANVSSEFILILCHDDLLNTEGLKELLNKKIDSKDTVFGSHVYFSSDRNKFICKELLANADGLDVKQFILNDIDRNYKFNISGTIFPKVILQEVLSFLPFFKYGYRFDNFMAANPLVKKIHQTNEPIVKIREHRQSAGQQNIKKLRATDNLAYYFINLALQPFDKQLFEKCSITMLKWIFTSKLTIIHSFLFLIKLQIWFLFKYGTSIKKIAAVYFYMGRWLLQVIVGKVKNKISDRMFSKRKIGFQSDSQTQQIIMQEKQKKNMVFKCFYPQVEKNFGESDGGKEYGYGLLYPLQVLIKNTESLGYKIYSAANFPIEKADVLVCIDLSPNTYELLSQLPRETKKILVASESPVYSPSSHNGDIINSAIWDFVLTWNKSYIAKHIKHFDHPYTGKQLLTAYPLNENRIEKGVVVSSFKNDLRGNTHTRDSFYINLAKSEYVEIYGRGWAENTGVQGTTSDKIQTIAKYKFSLICENSVWPGYVTEKLPDSILAGTPAIYYGDIETANKRFNGTFVPLKALTVEAFLEARETLLKNYEKMVKATITYREESDRWCDHFLNCWNETVSALR